VGHHDDGSDAEEVNETWQDVVDDGVPSHHLIRDPVDFGYSGWNIAPRVNELLELVRHCSIATEPNGSDLDNLRTDRMKTGCLQIERYKLRLV